MQGAPPVSTTPAAKLPLVSKTVSSTLGYSKVLKKIKYFPIEIFFDLPPVVHLQLRISPRIFEKIRMVLMGYSGAGGKLIQEKNLKLKISLHCPFKAPWPFKCKKQQMWLDNSYWCANRSRAFAATTQLRCTLSINHANTGKPCSRIHRSCTGDLQ